jgi:CheY-like chemotaxis protein
MSHELRTPLNAVIGFAEILRDGLAGPLNDEQLEYVGDIYGSGRHLLALINDILDLSKVEAGQMELDLQSVAPAELAASGVAVVRERAGLRRVQLTELCPPDLGPLQLDVRRTKQIVYNLLSNAVKFTPDGGSVGIALRRISQDEVDAVQDAADRRVFRPRERWPHWLELSVSDTGIGIAPEALGALFAPFVQVDSSLDRRFEGTGLGLTMVQRLTELHGGGLALQSTPGQGSTFTIWLPWREARAVEPGPAPPLPSIAAPADPARPQILLIEDDPRAASLMRVQLANHGYRVELALDAEQGLARADTLRPDAIVLDVILPGMDGWHLLARLKDRETLRSIPVVIVSITDEPRRGFALGATQVLVKPVAQEDLLAALAAAGLEPREDGRGGGRVLVVDDDPKAVTLVCKHLEAAGFEPIAAYGGQQALELARRSPVDLIVLDLMMPQVSGFDVVEGLAARPETAQIPIVVLTAKLVTAEDRELLRGRVQRIVEKTEYSVEGLLAEVRRALLRRQAPATRG